MNSQVGEKINSRAPILRWLRALGVVTTVACIGLYIYFSPWSLMHNYSGMLLFPMLAEESIYALPAISGVKKEDIYFKNADGNTLHGWFFNKSGSRKTVLVTHGNGGNISHRIFLIQALLDADASVFAFDYRGYGLSSGIPTIPGILADTQTAYEYLRRQRKIPAQDIVLYGESIGGGPAAYLFSIEPVGGIILDSTFTSILHVGQKKLPLYRIYPDFLGPDPALDVKSSIAGKHPPLLLIHGVKDEIIPYSEAKENFAAASEPKQLISLENSTHNNKGPNFTTYCSALKDYFKALK